MSLWYTNNLLFTSYTTPNPYWPLHGTVWDTIWNRADVQVGGKVVQLLSGSSDLKRGNKLVYYRKLYAIVQSRYLGWRKKMTHTV